MINLVYGLGTVLIIWWLSRLFARSNPAQVAKIVKRAGGGLAVGTAVLLAARGRIDMALLVGGIGAWLLGWSGLPWRGFPGQARTRATASVSKVRSALIEMELDHDTGEMSGTVLAGPFATRSLASLTEPELLSLYEDCRRADPDGVRLLEAYLDRRFPRWREDADRHGDAGPGAGFQAGAMTEEEAYQILGLEPGADAEAIRRAHRALMMKFHPDQGGTSYLAVRINQAKDVLLNRHR